MTWKRNALFSLLISSVMGCNLITGVNDLKFDEAATDTDTDTDTDADADTDTDTDTDTDPQFPCSPPCHNAVEIDTLPFTHSSDTVDAYDCFDGYSCNSWLETGTERYYVFQPQDDVSVSISLSNTDADFDIIILGEEGGECSADACVTAADDQVVDQCLFGGETYYIVIDGFSGAQGSYTLNISETGECQYPCDIDVSLDMSGTFPPTGWTIVDGGSSGADGNTWMQSSVMKPQFPPATAMDGEFAMLDADAAGNGTFMQESLISPWYQINTCNNVAFAFDHYFHVYVVGGEEAIVDVQLDSNSNPWITLGNWTDSLSDRQHECYNLTTELHGADRFRVRFYYTNTANWGWFWYVDDVSLQGDGSC